MNNCNFRTLISFLATAMIFLLNSCKANPPSRAETKIIQESKDLVIGGRDWHNPVPLNAASLKLGAEHFQHHCQICHGLDGHATGVTFARNMSPPVPDLGTADIQKYTDGQMKWIIDNGIRMTGMPAWKGLLEDDEMWQMVHYIRHLPSRGSLGAPEVFVHEGDEHARDREQHSQE